MDLVRLHCRLDNRWLWPTTAAGAILDRFLHHAQVIAITGKSYRVKEAPALNQENKKGRKPHEPSTATSKAETE